MDTMSGYKALAIMRDIRHRDDAWFEIHHLTWNQQTRKTNGMRIVRRAKLRPALPNEVFKEANPELYLTYVDLDANHKNQNRICRRRLIRFVAFPPEFKLMKVIWLP
jgi:hypothetical protein